MSNIKIVQLGKYTTPEVSENKGDKWVEYGDNNSYYYTLLEAKKSPTNSALINGISNLIYGRGLGATDATRKVDEYAAMVSLFDSDTVRKVTSDYYTLGQGAFQVIYNAAHNRIVQVEHMPIQELAPEKCDEKGNINAYYHCDDWANLKPNSELKRIPAFGTSKEGLEILVIKPYKSGFYYFTPVEYQSGLDYAFLEIELSKFHLNNVHNRFSANMIINFNNGVPDDDERRSIETKIKNKYTGSEGEGIVVSFNDDNTKAATIETPQLSDAHSQYQFIAEEAARKLMVSHKVTSPLLFGLPQNGGLGSNADEIKMSALLFDNTVIKPIQRVILDGINKILAFNDVSLKTFFITSQPLEFTEMEVEDLGEEEAQEKTGVKMSHHDDFDDDELLDFLQGELLSEDWDLLDSRELTEDGESTDDWMSGIIDKDQTTLQKLADFIKSRPSGESQLDKSVYKVRYSYEEKYSSGNSRKFCSSMMRRTANGVVYRLEDIDKATRAGVNRSFGHKGQPYDLFKYKGGVNCGHYWQENLYKLKKKKDGSYVEDKSLSSSNEVDSIPKSYEPRPRGRQDAKKAPKDMPNNGRHPSNR